MEVKDPMVELLSSLEQIVLTRNVGDTFSAQQEKTVSVPEPQRLREMTGMKIDEFARVMGVSVSSVKSWEARRTRPSGSAQKLMQLLHSNPYLGRQLLDCACKYRTKPATGGFFCFRPADEPDAPSDRAARAAHSSVPLLRRAPPDSRHRLRRRAPG